MRAGLHFCISRHLHVSASLSTLRPQSFKALPQSLGLSPPSSSSLCPRSKIRRYFGPSPA